ncbi:branched-chain amino acid ABC transporter permease [Bradyrhizobium sp. LjRoot220]|uniref:branched-chain amino acid ABC transporter permease n=1 Tax=Bradyrhizobium sp. LjRoot220 TaxID=3342284 RepID=UPI003ECC1DCB
MATALQILLDALLLAGIYAIGALGFALIWGVLNVLNIAYAAFIMLGGYLSYFLWKAGIDPLVTIPIVMSVLFAVGYATQELLFKYVLGGPASLGISLSYGLNLLLVGLVLYFLSAEYRSINLPDYLRGYAVVFGAKLTYARIATFLIALTLTAAVWVFVDRTELGAAIRATRLDPEAAKLVGIRIGSIFNLTAGISGALAGAMGALITLVYSAFPGMGDHYLLQILVVTVLGGLGSLIGPLIGALIVGFASSAVANVFGATYSMLVGMALVWVALILFPNGILGRRFYEA